MDDRFYLAVYDEERMLGCGEPALLRPEDFVCDVVLPSYELCDAGGFQAVRRSRFSEAAGKLYQLDEGLLSLLDEMMAPELIRHQAMAADQERLYNVYVYVAGEQEAEAHG